MRGCPLATLVACKHCGYPWEPEDIRVPGPCPVCASPRYYREPCSECEKEKLKRALFETNAGILIRNVVDIDHALQMRIHVTLDDLTPEEFVTLRILNEERNKKQQEDIDKSEREARKPMGIAGNWRG